MSWVFDAWPQVFREHILPILPVNALAPFFCANNGRPTKDIPTLLGVFIIQEALDMSDLEALRALSLDIGFRWALDINEGNDNTLYICPKTLYNFRKIIKKNKLDEKIFNETIAAILAKFNVNPHNQRMDSVHFSTNMKKLSRLGVMSGTVKKFLKALKAHDPESLKSLDSALVERYLKEDKRGFDYFGGVKPSQRDQVLLTVARDIFDLVIRFRSDAKVAGLAEFGLVERVFREQCQVGAEERLEIGAEVTLRSDDAIDESSLDLEILDEDPLGGEAEIEAGIEMRDGETDAGGLVFMGLRPAKEVGADSLQSPTDPDAGFSGHKGKGYQAQLVETFTAGDAVDADDYHLNLVTYVKVESASEPDSAALVTAVDDLVSRGLAPDALVADTAYGSDANYRYADSKGINLVSPVSGSKRNGAGNEPEAASFSSEPGDQTEGSEDGPRQELRGDQVRLSDFNSTDEGVVTACPMGHETVSLRSKSGNGGRAYFNRETCLRCGRRASCPVTITKNKAWLAYHDFDVRLDKRRAHQETDNFKRAYRKRSGIEATNSQLARMGLKRLRVRGLETASFKIFFKVLALNTMRVCKKVIHDKKKSKNAGAMRSVS